MKEILKDKKKLGIIGGGLLLLIIIIVLIIVFAKKDKSNEEYLNDTLKEMGVDFYENYYYEHTGKDDDAKKTFLAKYKDIGIKVDLDNLSRYNSKVNEEKLKEFVNSKTNKECDKGKTKITIYPKDPYRKKDYEIKVELSCGFEDKK